jgi:hypothetical protein
MDVVIIDVSKLDITGVCLSTAIKETNTVLHGRERRRFWIFKHMQQHKIIINQEHTASRSTQLLLFEIQFIMFACKFTVGSFRHSAATSSRSAWRAFSNTAATFADQYDVVIVGTLTFRRFHVMVVF